MRESAEAVRKLYRSKSAKRSTLRERLALHFLCTMLAVSSAAAWYYGFAPPSLVACVTGISGK